MGLAVILILVFVVLYIKSLRWAYEDAEARGKSGWQVALLVGLMSWPVSILLWLVIRPEEKFH